jgi:hypothetical protein
MKAKNYFFEGRESFGYWKVRKIRFRKAPYIASARVDIQSYRDRASWDWQRAPTDAFECHN